MKKIMKKEELKRRRYVRPSMEVIKEKADTRILAGSPIVQPGGGGGGSVIVVPPSEDDDDTELSGAKRFSMWGKWDEN